MGRTLNTFSPSKKTFTHEMYNSKYSENFETVNSAQKQSLLQPSQEIHMYDGDNGGQLSKNKDHLSHSELLEAEPTKKALTSAAHSKYVDGTNSRSGIGTMNSKHAKDNQMQNYY